MVETCVVERTVLLCIATDVAIMELPLEEDYLEFDIEWRLVVFD